ncbi:MAG: hypothetical protein U1D96_04045 [Eubacteriales bacterium]|nr:hypothetical protein [Bacillota bacterium]MBV1728577.1 hypothetical protein [Desulforudis sp.]MDP3051739.1 hypothetical protein [Eubacteriales bacterium]MDQ7790034.1 hypothetical protein [Clostridia bacterium]MBU4533724.1 hypothetical protein [Bacillota bacterium]
MDHQRWTQKQRQWRQFAEWERTQQPDGDASTRLRMVGELADLWVSSGGRPITDKDSVSEVGQRVRLMHKRLKGTGLCDRS